MIFCVRRNQIVGFESPFFVYYCGEIDVQVFLAFFSIDVLSVLLIISRTSIFNFFKRSLFALKDCTFCNEQGGHFPESTKRN